MLMYSFIEIKFKEKMKMTFYTFLVFNVYFNTSHLNFHICFRIQIWGCNSLESRKMFRFALMET